MNVDKICRCCLTNDGPLFTIYDGGTTTNNDSLAFMINKITGVKPEPNDKLPGKVCRLCIREIKDCYAFKIKFDQSHRTLKQLLLSKVKVQLCCPIKYPQTKRAIENNTIINVDEYKLAPVESKKTTKLIVSIDHNQSVKCETNIDSEDTISIPSPKMYFDNSSLRITDFKKIPFKKEFDNSEIDSWDSIEFISENPPISEPIVILDEHSEVNDTAVEYVFKNVSSPQWVPEEQINLSIVNEDFNFDNVQSQTNKSMEDLRAYPNNMDSCAGSHYQCVICKQEFKEEFFLTMHLETHEKPYSCIFCQNLFNDYSTLQMHLKDHTNNTLNSYKSKPNRRRVKRLGTRKHACDLCPMRFRVASVLINHRRIHTGERPHKCQYCDKTFIQSSTCRNHEKLHTGDRPHKCQYCNKTFVQSGNRIMHERTHTGEKPYKCQYCPRAFSQLNLKVKHEKTHQKSEITDSSCVFQDLSSEHT